jgi:hypothetical protein
MGFVKRQHQTDLNLFFCPRCLEYKSRGEFRIDNRTGWPQYYCKPCESALNRLRYKKMEKGKTHKRQHPTNPNLFLCIKCQEYKPRECFSFQKGSVLGIKSCCKGKCSGRTKEELRIYYEKTREALRKKHRELFPLVFRSVICGNCEKVFETSDHKLNYCSKECRENHWRREGMLKHECICKTCGITFISDKEDRSYCSRYCMTQDKSLVVKCPTCGESRYLNMNSGRGKSTMRDCIRCYNNNRNHKRALEISDIYISGRYKISIKELTPDLAEVLRHRIIANRTLKELKNLIREKEHESDRDFVSGEQHKDEEVNESYRGSEETGHGGDCGMSA